jgi:hypothetical protein
MVVSWQNDTIERNIVKGKNVEGQFNDVLPELIGLRIPLNDSFTTGNPFTEMNILPL